MNTHDPIGDMTMALRFLGKGGTEGGGCPSLYVDQDIYTVQGWETGQADTVEIPHLLVGFAEPDTFIGAKLEDTGRGTFLVAGRPVTDSATLEQMDIYPGETVITVPKLGRTFYGHASSAG
ncbi:hypothetical protein [Nocardia salmonicida]|uniref:hypothetical protein n=1 Tax=Nocardia salmonicida TaxID=53431 RepID=UPI0037B638C2